MYESARDQKRAVPDSLEKRAAKIVAVQINAGDVRRYFAAVEKTRIVTGKIVSVTLEHSRVTIDTTDGKFSFPLDTEIWVYDKPFIITSHGIGVEE